METERWQNILLVVVLVVVGGVAWSFKLRPELTVDPSPLASLPHDLASWESEDIPLDDTVEGILRADYNVQRVYLHPLGEVVWLYVGYYGTERGGRTEHAPEVCYPSAGWTMHEELNRVVAYGDGLRANELVVERAGERRLVHYWYQSHRANDLLGGIDQTLDRLFGRLLQGRADGAFVRISTPLDEDLEAARSRLTNFARTVNPLIAVHWPEEVPTTTRS